MHIPLEQSEVYRLPAGPWHSVTRIKPGKFLLMNRNRVDQYPTSLKCGKYASISRCLQRSLVSKLSQDGRLLVCVQHDWEIILFDITTLVFCRIGGLKKQLEDDLNIREDNFDCILLGSSVEVVVVSERSAVHWSGVTTAGDLASLKGGWRSRLDHNLPAWSCLCNAFHPSRGCWLTAGASTQGASTEAFLLSRDWRTRTSLASSSPPLTCRLDTSTSLLCVGAADSLTIIRNQRQ